MVARTEARVDDGFASLESAARPAPTGAHWAAVSAVVAVGLGLRLYLLYHLPLDSDEAVVGLMAGQIRHGHFFTFYWGQAYGGVEPYLVAAWTAVAGSGPVALNAVPTVLCALGAVLAWRIARRLVPAETRALAAAAGLVLWIWPEVVIYNSVQELGFRGVTLVSGLGVLLLALRVSETGSVLDCCALGLCAGIGWWSSPEIVYFAVPAALLLVARRARLRAAGLRRLALVLLAAGIGAAPWLVTNLRTGFLSLRVSSSPVYTTATYAERLSMFFTRALPMALGLRLSPTASWLWGRVGEALYVVAVGALSALCVVALAGARSPGGHRALGSLAAGILVFPVVFALFPATGSWDPGRYVVFLTPLVVLLATGVLGEALPPARRRRDGPAGAPAALKAALSAGRLAALVVAAASVVSLASFDTAWLSGRPGRFVSGWGDAVATAARTVSSMEADNIRGGYASYWIAYDLDELSGGHLIVSDPTYARWPAENVRAGHLARPAWIFPGPAQKDVASAFPSDAESGDLVAEPRFLAALQELGIRWRRVRVGVLVAVVPNRAVTPAAIAATLAS